MRLWSINPQYLDVKGLVALWREGLGALATLKKKQGYYQHPQLERFKSTENPIGYINTYLYDVWIEATNRGYKFDICKLDKQYIKKDLEEIKISTGQIKYEMQHLQNKLKKRDENKYNENIISTKNLDILPHLLFKTYKSEDIENWEVV